MTAEEIQSLVDAAVEKRIAALQPGIPETPDQRLRKEQDRWNDEQGKLHLEGIRNACLSRRAMVKERMVDPVLFFTKCREVLDEITPEFERLRAAIVEANKTGASRRPFERQLDALEQVLDGLMRGKWDESGNLEDRLRAKGVPSSSPKFFSNRRSLARTQAVIEAWTQELDDNEKRLAEVEAQLAEVTAKLQS